MKYRIKQEGDKFYPQRKCFLFWCGWKGKAIVYTYWSYLLEIEATAYENLYFDTIKEAKDFIIEDKKKRKVIFHEFLV